MANNVNSVFMAWAPLVMDPSPSRPFVGDRYDLIMKAADHIEQNPQLYNFNNARNPWGGDPSGCMLGRIAHFAKVTYWSANYASNHILGMEPQNFFEAITNLAGGAWNTRTYPHVLHDPKAVVPAMREFAKLYKPAPQGIPDSVKQIFEAGAIEKALESV